MKSRKDLIVRAGFGELSAAEEAKLGTLTAQEREQVERVKKMREGLKSLRDVPECQMSTERLRDAILNRGVAPSRQSRPLTYGVVAAAAILVIYFGSQLDVLADPETVGTVDSRSVDEIDVFPPFGPLVIPGAPGVAGLADSVDVIPDSFAAGGDIVALHDPGRSVASSGSASRSVSRFDELADWGAFDWQNGSGANVTPVDFTPQPDAAVGLTFAASPVPADDEPSNILIVIDYVENPDTGAFVATEVETFGDVVFGG